MPVILALGRWRQEKQGFSVEVYCVVFKASLRGRRLSLRNNKVRERWISQKITCHTRPRA